MKSSVLKANELALLLDNIINLDRHCRITVFAYMLFFLREVIITSKQRDY